MKYSSSLPYSQIFLSNNPPTLSIFTRSCFIESRSRTVTALSSRFRNQPSRKKAFRSRPAGGICLPMDWVSSYSLIKCGRIISQISCDFFDEFFFFRKGRIATLIGARCFGILRTARISVFPSAVGASSSLISRANHREKCPVNSESRLDAMRNKFFSARRISICHIRSANFLMSRKIKISAIGNRVKFFHSERKFVFDIDRSF